MTMTARLFLEVSERLPHIQIGGYFTIQCEVHRDTPMIELRRLADEITHAAWDMHGRIPVRVQFQYGGSKHPRYVIPAKREA